MPDRRRIIAIVWTAATVASLVVAGSIAIDTIRTTVSLHSALPWFDDWNSVNLFRDWSLGTSSALAALSSQFGEHRLLVPRLVFFADDLFFRGQGWLGLAGILLVQAAHAGLFAWVLSRVAWVVPRNSASFSCRDEQDGVGESTPSCLAGAACRGSGRLAVAGLIVALMFSLRQAPNFSSVFQLQFVGVFAAATLAFVLFGRVAARAESGLPVAGLLAGSLIAAAVSTFCMANGLICALLLVALALVARLPIRIVAICGAVWLVLALLYFRGYHVASDHTPLADALRRPVGLMLYAATYLGNLAGRANPRGAAALGFVGAAATAAAAVLVVRRGVERRAGLALLGVMLFCSATALVTATGRLNAGIGQALEERYVTGSVTFWSSQLCFWWIAAPARVPRATMLGLGAWLAVVLVGAQGAAKPALYQQKFAEDDARDLLLLGLDDPETILRTAWDIATVRRDVPFMRDAAFSISGGPDADLFGRPLAETERIAPPETCTGEIGSATSDPSLGRDGVRVGGQGWDAARNRRLRRILLVDGDGTIAGLAISGVPGGKRTDWRGFAVAPVASILTAYGVVDGDRVCRLGTATVAAASRPPGEPSSGPGPSGIRDPE